MPGTKAQSEGQDRARQSDGCSSLGTGLWGLGQLGTCCGGGAPGHCGYCLPEFPSSQYLPPPPRPHHTVNTAHPLPARGGVGSACTTQAKGASLLRLRHPLRKCGYCSASTGVDLECECWRRKGQRPQGVQKPRTTESQPPSAASTLLLCSHTRGTRRAVEVVQACHLNAWAVQAGKSQVQGHPQLHSKFEAKLSTPPHPQDPGHWRFLGKLCRSTLARSKAPHISPS